MPLDAVFGSLRDRHAPSTGAPGAVGLCGAVPIHGHAHLSPGLGFGTPVAFEPGMAAALEQALSRPGGISGPVVLGLDTDPYQPVERTLRLTRAALEVLERFGHPAAIVTRCVGVAGDLDLLRRLASRGLVRVWFAVATLDPALARVMEPRAAAPARRWQAVEVLRVYSRQRRQLQIGLSDPVIVNRALLLAIQALAVVGMNALTLLQGMQLVSLETQMSVTGLFVMGDAVAAWLGLMAPAWYTRWIGRSSPAVPA